MTKEFNCVSQYKNILEENIMKENLKKMISYYKPYKRVFFADTFFAIIASIVALIIPLVVRYITSTVVHMNPQQAFKQILYIAIAVFVLIIIQIYCNYFISNYGHVMGAKIEYDMRAEIFAHFQKMPFSFFDDQKVGQLMSRITSDLFDITELLHHGPENVTISVIKIIGALCILLSIDKKLALAAFALVPFMIVYAYFFNKKMKQTFRINRKKIAAINEQIEDNLSGIRVVKSYVREEYEKQKFSKAANTLRKLFEKAEGMMALVSPIMNLAVYGCIVALSWFGAHQIVGGTLTTGQLTSMFSYIMAILMSLMMLSTVIVMITMSFASAKRIDAVINEVADIQNPEQPVMKVADGSIDFDHVNFSYASGSGENVLNDIDLHIYSGETIGIIGGTGSGKSTFVSLISRLYDVTKGDVKVGGVNVKDYDIDTLRNEVSVVLQKNVLFSGTVLENLRWGNENASEEECWKACELACADEFLKKNPDGLQARVEQGGNNFSGGQKQRLCIARALLKSPKVLILDDSTSAVDTATDAKIQNAFQTEIPDTTKIIISQRISSVKNADRIIVIDNGKISGFDSHENLLKTNTIYREIEEAQNKAGGDFDKPQMD